MLHYNIHDNQKGKTIIKYKITLSTETRGERRERFLCFFLSLSVKILAINHGIKN